MGGTTANRIVHDGIRVDDLVPCRLSLRSIECLSSHTMSGRNQIQMAMTVPIGAIRFWKSTPWAVDSQFGDPVRS